MAKKDLQGLLSAVQKTSATRRESHQLDVEDLGGGRQLPQSGKVVPLSKIRPSPYQPRIDINEAFIDGLRESMQTAGLATPVLVRPVRGEDAYELIDGHRRVVAAQHLGWDEIAAHVRELTDSEAAIQALVTNVDREGYSDYELGCAFKRLLDGGIVKTKKGLEELTGLSRPAIYRALGLTELPGSMLAILNRYPALIGGNTGDVLRKMVDAGDENIGITALEKILDGNLKESHLAAWWGLQKRQQQQLADETLRPHLIRNPGRFDAKIRVAGNGSLSVTIKPANGVDRETLKRALIEAIEGVDLDS